MNGVWLRSSCAVTTSIIQIITQQGEAAPFQAVLPLQRLNPLAHLLRQLQAERSE